MEKSQDCAGDQKAYPITPEEAKKIIEAQKQQRIQQCSQKLQEVLDAHDCRLEAQITIRGAEILSHIVVLTREQR